MIRESDGGNANLSSNARLNRTDKPMPKSKRNHNTKRLI